MNGLETLWSSVRYSVRSLSKRPGFTAVVVATLALGIGANTAVFSFVNALLLRPLPFPEPERLVEIRASTGSKPGRLTAREYQTLRDESRFLESVAAYYPSQYNLTGEGPPEALLCTINTKSLFDVLGVSLLHGDPWDPATEKEIGFEVILNHGLWTRLGADPSIVGESITLDAHAYHVAGVLPPGVDFPASAEFFRSMTQWGDEKLLDARRGMVVARLARGASLAEAGAELSAIARRLALDFPASNRGVTLELRPLKSAYLGEARPYLLLLFGAVAFVLLIACANVVNLLLTRASGKSREAALALALGASRGRLTVELLVESVLLSLAGGVLGAALALAVVKGLSALVVADLPFWMKVEVDVPVLLFTLAVSLATGVLSGLAPALESTRASLVGGLREGAKGSSGRATERSRRFLVVLETALALMLLVGAGLTLKTLWKLAAVDLGFDPERVLTFRTDPPWTHYSTREQTARFYRRAIEELEALPGVERAAMNQNPPLSAHKLDTETLTAEGQSRDEIEQNPFVNLQIVSPNYFEALSVPVKRGETFTGFDDERSPPKAVVSESLASRFWPGEDPVGKRFQLGKRFLMSAEDSTEGVWIEVVGVSGDVRHQQVSTGGSLDLYVSNLQFFAGDAYFLVRYRDASSPAALMAQKDAVTAAIQRVDPEQSIFDVQPFEDRVADRIWQQRLSGTLLVAFGLLALVLAAVGIYGVLSYAVSRRTRDLGIRMALGASRKEVLGEVLYGSMKLTAFGIALGVLGAFFLSRVLGGFVEDLAPGDPLLYGASTAALALVSLASAYLPARRATRVDPVVALRSE
jgi:putative ABC transport system permease protein